MGFRIGEGYNRKDTELSGTFDASPIYLSPSRESSRKKSKIFVAKKFGEMKKAL